MREPPGIPGRQRVVVHQRPDSLHHFRNRQQTLYARKVDASVIDEPFDGPKALQFLARVDAHAANGAAWLHEPETLVLAERLRMHAQHPGGDTDEVEILRLHWIEYRH